MAVVILSINRYETHGGKNFIQTKSVEGICHRNKLQEFMGLINLSQANGASINVDGSTIYCNGGRY